MDEFTDFDSVIVCPALSLNELPFVLPVVTPAEFPTFIPDDSLVPTLQDDPSEFVHE